MMEKIKEILLIPFFSTKTVAIISAIITMIYEFLKADALFIFTVTTFVIIDTALAFYIAGKQKKISSQKFSKVFEKIIIYIILLTLTHIAALATSDFMVEGLIFSQIQSIVFTSIILRELISILEKTSILNIFIIPRKLYELLENYKTYTHTHENENENENEND